MREIQIYKTGSHAISTIKGSNESQLISSRVASRASSESIMSNYISSLTPIRALTFVAEFSTSFFTLGNATSAWHGVVPAVLKPEYKLSEKQKADLWLFFFRRGLIFPAATIVASLSFATVAYLTSVPKVQQVAIAGALCSGAIVPYTAQFLMPVNNQLTAISHGDSAKEPYAGKLVQKWANLHVVRIVLGSIAWGCAIYLREVVVA